MSDFDDDELVGDEVSDEKLQESIWVADDLIPNQYYSIYVTCASLEEAREIGKKLIALRVAACVNIIPRIVSLYEWRDKTQEENESVMFIKTRGDKVKDVMIMVKKLHSYEVPAILVFPLKAGFKPYFEWIDEQIRHKKKSNRKSLEE